MTYLSVSNFWKYQNADVWKKSRTHPPWFKHFVHRDREMDALPVEARLLWVELLGAATRHSNVIGLGPLPMKHGLSEAEAKLRESERNLSWICGEVRMEPEEVAEMLPLLIKGGWLSETQTPRRSRKVSRETLEDPRDQDLDVDLDKEEDQKQDTPEVQNVSEGSTYVKASHYVENPINDNGLTHALAHPDLFKPGVLPEKETR